MKRKELFWMIVPCLLLVGLGWFMHGKKQHSIETTRTVFWTPKPFRLVVEKVKIEPVTPLQAFQGYDTKIKVTLNHSGATPPWWGNMSNDAGTSQPAAQLVFDDRRHQSPIKLTPNIKNAPKLYLLRPALNSEHNRYVANFLVNLSNVPQHSGTVKIRAYLAPENFRGMPFCPPVFFQFTVRNKNQVIRPPHIEKSGLHIENVVITELPPITKQGYLYHPDLRVRLNCSSTSNIKNTETLYCTGAIYDESEKKYNIWRNSETKLIDFEHTKNMLSFESATNPLVEPPNSSTHFSAVMDLDIRSLPATVKRPILKGYVVVGDAWPLEFFILLRDAQGKTIKTPLKPAPFSIESVEVRPTTAKEQQDYVGDTVVKVNLKYFGDPTYLQILKNNQLEWHYDWSQHLEDENHKQYWLFNWPSGGGEPISADYGYSSDSIQPRLWLNYYIPLTQVPSTVQQVQLKAEVSVEGSERLPISVVLRKDGKNIINTAKYNQ